MKKHFALIFCLLLAGCTDADWDHAMTYTGLESKDVADPPQAPPAAAVAATPEAANTDFCRSVATQDATSNDFDQPTQARVFARSYAQCVAIYTR